MSCDDSHAVHEKGIADCKTVLSELKDMVEATPLIATDERRTEWLQR